MPARTTVDAFIAQVISGDHVGAIRDWYHDDAWMQENQAPPRQGGREALMKREAAVMERSQSVKTELLGGPLIEGDQVAIRWRFTFAFKETPGADGLKQYDIVKSAIQQGFMDLGGTLSHHHAVGVEHAQWLEQDVSPAGVAMIRTLLDGVDPGHNLNPGKIVTGP